MDSEQVKQNIRRRLFAEKLKRVNSSHAAASENFTICHACKGTGKVCSEYMENGNPVAELNVCAMCEGAGFIERTA